MQQYKNGVTGFELGWVETVQKCCLMLFSGAKFKFIRAKIKLQCSILIVVFSKIKLQTVQVND